MSMKEWAKREVEIACKRERGNAPEGEFDYGCACYESALKAFNSLLEDGHSGTSIGFTQNILNRLIDGKPLGPIEDAEDVWELDKFFDCEEYVTYQCKRMSSLFKRVYKDGTVTYSDTDLIVCVNINKPDIVYNFRLIRDIAEELFPITFPYYPSAKPIRIYCEDFLTDELMGDFDTVGIFNAVKPGGEQVEINRFFKMDVGDKDWVEIDIDAYKSRYLRKIQKGRYA